MHKEQILSSQTISSNTNSSVVNLRLIDNYAVQVNVTAVSSPSGGNVKLQGSNDNSNWSDLSGTSNSISATGTILINRVDDGFKYIRAVFEISSGSYTADAVLTGRERKV